MMAFFVKTHILLSFLYMPNDWRLTKPLLVWTYIFKLYEGYSYDSMFHILVSFHCFAPHCFVTHDACSSRGSGASRVPCLAYGSNRTSCSYQSHLWGCDNTHGSHVIPLLVTSGNFLVELSWWERPKEINDGSSEFKGPLPKAKSKSLKFVS